ncbi:MAG: hypothetical protein PHP51_07830 [Desulfotomaculaceae bacterium]|nr:hypothetical protein [Desulfotomaculaceae bacterium]MDD4766957.1 hypothetical protein [Desulfotomaculaceae bacterium]
MDWNRRFIIKPCADQHDAEGKKYAQRVYPCYYNITDNKWDESAQITKSTGNFVPVIAVAQFLRRLGCGSRSF